MKLFLLLLFIIFSAACTMQTVESQKQVENRPTEIANPPSKQAVLIELFTSEG